ARERPADDLALEGRADVVDHVAVGIRDDLMVRRRRVDADEPPRPHLEPRFFADFPHDRLAHRLARLDAAAGQAPQMIVAAELEEDALRPEDDRRHAGADHHGARLYGCADGARKRRHGISSSWPAASRATDVMPSARTCCTLPRRSFRSTVAMNAASACDARLSR